MTREEKILLAIEKGVTCDPITGKVYGVRGKEIIKKNPLGYVILSINNDKNQYYLRAHQFIYYWVHKTIVDCIDHINGITNDNRIENLRSVTLSQNQQNQTKAKGYVWVKNRNKWQANIKKNDKTINLGRFDTEQEARQAYLNAKEIYHII